MERVLLPPDQHKQQTDDLKLIRGIGPAMEQRLNQAGIFTFAQLASVCAEDLAALFADMPGLSAARIAEKDWIHQAHLLMEKETAVNDSAPDGQYSAVFSVDLLLDSQNRVRRTHVLHVQSRKEDSWADWNKDRLASFIFDNAAIRSTRKILQGVETPKKATPITGGLNILDLEIQSDLGRVTPWEVRAEEPFAIALVLDMSKASVPAGAAIQYQAEIYVKNLTNGKRQNIGVNSGSLEAKDRLPVVVNCRALPQGSYRLEACAMLAPDLENPDPRFRLIAMTEGRVFRAS